MAFQLPARVESFEKVAPGKYKGVAAGYPFTVEGGKALGGNRNEWFLNWGALGSGDVEVTGPRDALRVIDRT